MLVSPPTDHFLFTTWERHLIESRKYLTKYHMNTHHVKEKNLPAGE